MIRWWRATRSSARSPTIIRRSSRPGWGPTKLAHAILFATITNIVAYIPFLLLTGTTGEFLYSLPIVMTCALVASRLVSMTFIPFLGYYLLRPTTKKESTMEERRSRGFSGFYYRVGKFVIDHRWKAFARVVDFPGAGRILRPSPENAIFPGGRAIPFIP